MFDNNYFQQVLFLFSFYDQVCSATTSDALVSDDVTQTEGKKRANNVDKIARIGFPLAFLLFNLIYWVAYYYRLRNKTSDSLI
jgi:hypothetical protein